MNDRIIDVSHTPAKLSIDVGRLSIQGKDVNERVALRHIGALIVSCPGVTYTHAVLAALMDAGIPFICCDGRHQPSGLLLPLVGHSTQTERFRRQTELGLPARKRLWQAIVQAKIRGQAAILQRLGRANPLDAMPRRVKSGDPDNMEAQAARLYWPLLFGKGFDRRREECGINARLNYGYAVIRAMTGRALVGAGLHPSLGVHHHNRYDAYCLAGDMMEPFRPIMDEAVAAMRKQSDAPLCPEDKQRVIAAISCRFMVEGESRTLEDCITRACESLAGCIMGTRKTLSLPSLDPVPRADPDGPLPD